MRHSDKSREPEQCDFPELRAWYAAIHARLRSEPDLPAGEVIASWARIARPMVRQVPEPSNDERSRQPDRGIRTSDDKWLTRMREVPTEYDGPLEEAPDSVMYLDRVVPAIHVDGRTIYDREEALDATIDSELTRRLIHDLLPSGRTLGARKGVHRDTLARALLLWSLIPLGQRRAARCVIVWDQELGPGLANSDAAEAVRHFQAGELENALHRQLRENAEWAVITASRRIWETIGLTDETSLRI